MTTDTLDAAAPVTRRPRAGGRLHGLLWLVWRQNRVAVWLGLAVVVLGTGWLLTEHLAIADGMDTARRAGCGKPTEWRNPGCNELWNDVYLRAQRFPSIVQPALALLPLLIGLFLGAPLLAQEYEHGTLRLLWTQSVSRSRWLAFRLGGAGLIVLLVSGSLAGAAGWFWLTDVHRGFFTYALPFAAVTYPVIGPVAVATALFALALGAVAGMLLRRTLPAMAATGGALAAVELGLYALRPHLYPLVHTTQVGRSGRDFFHVPEGAWMVSNGTVLPDGSKVPFPCGSDLVCQASRTFYGDYHPVSHLLPIQLIESGILLLGTAALVAFAFHRLRRAAV
ncbi:ABC transporter permease subunit [Streptomyces sp. H39-S7]|uniref:ABC transporter permease subunit n=1 Tax=Streptomyces sp. H39-S7 TaxID=3004357 RepID=UPI0022AE91B8|nr:ABC transporter permease subunit [Streptomyces sp. H39-S7]MCZ4124389.1 ABC transporter permease subunit [Streptomyces sp. H39-S7]